jgi:hypothetical protein
VAGSCEHDDEPSGSIKSGEYLDQLRCLIAPEHAFCFMELVSFQIVFLVVTILPKVYVHIAYFQF